MASLGTGRGCFVSRMRPVFSGRPAPLATREITVAIDLSRLAPFSVKAMDAAGRYILKWRLHAP
jgi:hypothetical protein